MIDIQIRPAQPADEDEAVPLIYCSAPDLFNYLFTTKSKGNPQAFLKRVFLDSTGKHSFQNYTAALVQDRVVGVVSCYAGHETLSINRGIARNILFFYSLIYCWDIFLRGLHVDRILEPPKGDTLYMSVLGLAPEWRRQGIGSMLTAYLIEQGRTAKCSVAVLMSQLIILVRERFVKNMDFW
jgi:ribosomal protein S18 acetylase RimI-like enzyme